MGRILAIDYGLQRTGIAVSDPLKIIASPLTTVQSSELIPFLKDYTLREPVDVFVIGYPIDLKMRRTEVTEAVDQLLKKLAKAFPDKKVSLEDERYTSKIAFDAMITGGMKKKERRKKENIDKISATLILQSYLERNK